MPLSQQHRLALAGILLLVAASSFLLPRSARALPQSLDAPTASDGPVSAVAIRALRDLDTYQGECWTWMREVVKDATGKTVGFDYRQGFFDAGATEVTLAQAQEGDIIQMALDANTSPSADYSGLHTAIILENLGDGVFTVIDSNSQWDGMVHIRFNYAPVQRAAEKGMQFHIYRVGAQAVIGSTAVPTGASKVGSRVLAAGDRAIVHSGPEGLNLRVTPSTGKAPLALLSDGVSVTVTSAPVNAEGRTWVKVSTPLGDGWVAAEWVEKLAPAALTAPAAAPAPASGSGGDGPTRPVLPFRSFIPGIALSN